ncbi:MAG: hypothetical protein U5L11_01360 [Arhodomonas sp.]|nr:hypothetical protein [Arhodomonas sp.]
MGVGETTVFWLTAAVIDGGWYALVATALTGAGVVEWLRRHGVWVDRVTGCLLLGLAVVTVARVLSS